MKLYRGYEDPPHHIAEFKPWFTKFGRWYRYIRDTDDTQAGNVASLSALLAALVMRKLFASNINDEMISFLRVSQAGGISSYVEYSLKSLLKRYVGYIDLWSKLGILNGIKTDCAYLRYRSPKDGKEYRMGLVSPNYSGSGPNQDENCAFNKCIADIFLALNPDFWPRVTVHRSSWVGTMGLMVKGTSRMRASVRASSVLPEPVGPIRRMFDFASSTSLCLVW